MIQLSDHFNYKRLLRFTLPSIVTMVFTSIYGVVDGFFVSNFAGKTPFAAINFIMPVLMILGCIGFMFGTGGSALISLIMGEGNEKKAYVVFMSLLCWESYLEHWEFPSYALLPSFWGRKVKCWKTASYTEGLFCPRCPFLFCSLNFSACLPRLQSLIWDCTLPLLPV